MASLAFPPLDIYIFIGLWLALFLTAVVIEVIAHVRGVKDGRKDATLMVPSNPGSPSQHSEPSGEHHQEDAPPGTESKCLGLNLAVEAKVKRLIISFVAFCATSVVLTMIIFAILGASGILSMFLFSPEKASSCGSSCEYYEKDGLDGWVDDSCCTYDEKIGQQSVWISFDDSKDNCIHGYLLINRTRSNPTQQPLTLLYNHGSGGNIASGYRLKRYEFLLSQGNIAIFVFDYPGYGKSCGSPSAEGVVASSLAAAVWFSTWNEHYPNWNTTNTANFGREDAPLAIDVNVAHNFTNMTLLGRSMGGAVATYVGDDAHWRVHGLILQSTFSNLKDLVKAYFPMFGWILAGFVDSQFPQYSNTKNIKTFDDCLYHSHSENDEWVPFDEAGKIEDAANKKNSTCSDYVVVPDALHTQPLTKQERSRLSRWIEGMR